MGIFSKSMTAAQALESAMNASDLKAVNVAERKETAISTFRQTVNNLKSVNAELDEDIAELDEDIAFYTTQKGAAIKAKADNEAIAKHIIEIIGE